MSKLHIKKGDTVYVNAGEDKGKTGRVLKVLVERKRAIVEGINMVSKSNKAECKESARWYREARSFYPHFKLEPVDPKTGKATRIGREKRRLRTLVRYSKKSGEEIK